MEIHAIAHAYNGFSSKFGIPRQSGRAKSVLTRIVFEPDYRVEEALRGIEQWSHLWLIWGFSEVESKRSQTEWTPTVRPPRLGGNKRVGVFATRSPFRPNNLGLSSVELVRVEKTQTEGVVLWVSGADLMSGTPIFDIKPYLPYTDIHTEATCGFASLHTDYRLEVRFSDGLSHRLDEQTLAELKEILAEDPRPQYHSDANRIYNFEYSGYHISFRVENNTLVVVEVQMKGDKVKG